MYMCPILNGFRNRAISLSVYGSTVRVDNIKMDLREIGWDGVDWVDLAQVRDQWRALVNTVMNLRVP
jgi:hypothetical protein